MGLLIHRRPWLSLPCRIIILIILEKWKKYGDFSRGRESKHLGGQKNSCAVNSSIILNMPQDSLLIQKVVNKIKGSKRKTVDGRILEKAAHLGPYLKSFGIVWTKRFASIFIIFFLSHLITIETFHDTTHGQMVLRQGEKFPLGNVKSINNQTVTVAKMKPFFLTFSEKISWYCLPHQRSRFIMTLFWVNTAARPLIIEGEQICDRVTQLALPRV